MGTEIVQAPSNGADRQSPAPMVRAEGSTAINAFSSEASFGAAWRMAKLLASSTMVPQQYQGKPENCVIALELASRVGASVFAVMQNLDVIHGRPSWRAQFLIATVNSTGQFTKLRFQWSGEAGRDSWGCRAVAKDRTTGEECVGSLITIGLAKKEGWASKNGSKWQTMPEQMLMYRAAAFWARVYAPELSLGMQTADEVIDTLGAPVEETRELPKELVPGSTKALEEALAREDPSQPRVTDDGEVLDREPGSDG